MPYTAQERAKFLLWYVGCNDNYAQFGVKFRREMGRNAKVPGHKAMKDWKEKFLEQGSVFRRPITRTR